MSLSTLNFPPIARWCLPLLVLTLFAVYGSAVMGADVSGLYDAESPVGGNEAAERKTAIRDAFGKVLVKVTGSRRILSRKALAADLGNASRYVQQYRYEMLPAAKDGDQPGRLLQVNFDKSELDQLLHSRGLPVWNANRPSILVWLGMENRGKRRLLNPDADTNVRLALDRVATERGLPLVLPLMDLEDQGQMQVADLWGAFENNIRTASRRYAPDLILTGRLVGVDAGLWRADWRLYYAGSQSHWNSESSSQQTLIADALQRTADNLADRFAPLKEERSLATVRLRVAGIERLSDYAAVLNLLSAQNSLERVVLVSVEPDAVVYDLHGQGGVAVLERELGIGGLIESDSASAFQTKESAALVDLFFRMR